MARAPRGDPIDAGASTVLLPLAAMLSACGRQAESDQLHDEAWLALTASYDPDVEAALDNFLGRLTANIRRHRASHHSPTREETPG